MTETERATIVRDLNRQHDKVLNDLGALIEGIEQVLATSKPSGPLPLEGRVGEGAVAGTRFNHPSLVLRTDYRGCARATSGRPCSPCSLPVEGRGPESWVG